MSNENGSRTAINSYKGYEYQFYYFISLLFERRHEIKSIHFEKIEDVCVELTNGMIEYYQIKYHCADKCIENFSRKSGFTKVLYDFSENYGCTKEKSNKISKIYYVICSTGNEIDCTTFRNFTTKKKKRQYVFLAKKFEDIKHNTLKRFCKKLEFKCEMNFDFNNLIQKIYDNINLLEYYDSEEPTKIKKYVVLFKTLLKSHQNFFDKNEKIIPTDFFGSIRDELKSEFDIKIYFNEIIDGFMKNTPIAQVQLKQLRCSPYIYETIEIVQLFKLHKAVNEWGNANRTTIKDDDNLIKLVIFKRSFKKITEELNEQNINMKMRHLEKFLSSASRLAKNPNEGTKYDSGKMAGKKFIEHSNRICS